MNVSLDYLNECFILDEDSPTGLTWRIRKVAHFKSLGAQKRCNTLFGGKPAGKLRKATPKSNQPYYVLRFGKKTTSCHRLVYQMFHKKILDKKIDIDHIDGNGLNNKINNLREATRSQNCMNSGARVTNALGIKGVCFNKREKRFVAQINVKGKRVKVGSFDCPIKAKVAYDSIAKETYGEFCKS